MQKTKVDPFDNALGPINPEIRPWAFAPDHVGSRVGFGNLTLTSEGAAVWNAFRQACAVRNISVPKATILIIKHYISSSGV